MFRSLLLAGCACLSVFRPAPAAAAVPELSLADAVRLAADASAAVAARESAVVAADADRGRAGALPDPMLALGIDNLPVTGGQALDLGAEDMTMQRIGLRQELPSAAKRAARRAVADRRVEEARAAATAERLAVQRAAALAWINAWSARRLHDALLAQREQARLAATLAKARAAQGGPLAAALAAQAAELQLEDAVIQAIGDEDAARAMLARWVPAAGTRPLVGAPDLSRLPVPAEQLRARLDEIGPLLASQARVETAAAEVDAARAEKRPDWSVMAAYGHRGQDRSDMVSIEVGVSLPLFSRYRQDLGISARQADYEQALALREDARRDARGRLEAQLARWQTLHRLMAVYEQQRLPLARDRSATALAAYRAGGELEPWLQARADELDLERMHADHLQSLAAAWAELAFLLPETSP